MFHSMRSIARLAASAVLLACVFPMWAAASDCTCGECGPCHGGSVYSRAANHGLIHYPHATYWGSGDTHNPWGALDAPACFSRGIAPSPWAYSTIAPYSHQYHFFYGESYGRGDCFDCRN